MSSTLTVADARDSLYEHVVSDQNDPKFLRVLNEVCERILNSGNWDGTRVVVEFENPQGYVILPAKYTSVLASTLGGRPRSIYGRYHEYLDGGPGEFDATGGVPALVDYGETPLTEQFGDTSGTVGFSAPDDTSVLLRVFGLDDNGREVYDSAGRRGLELAHGVESTQVFSRISAVVKPATTGSVTLHVTTAGPVVTTIGEYLPGEVNPLYRVYKVGTYADSTIKALCKRRHIALVHETDTVLPGNKAALKLAMQAVRYEDNNDLERARAYWASCYEELNGELRSARGGETPRNISRPAGRGTRPVRNMY